VLPSYLHPDYVSTPADDRSNDIDILYVGNLHTPNNVFGLKWFAKEVFPSLEGLRLVVAGSKPTPEIYGALNLPYVQIVANPKEVRPLYARTRTIINPLWHGSGVNVKMIEALATGKPVISTSQGSRGLSERLLAHVSVADDARSFASAVLKRLADGSSATQRNDVIEEHGWKNVATLIQDLGALTGSKTRRSFRG
jgi:glycosyltransferase involved in cell wall biosynthesis